MEFQETLATVAQIAVALAGFSGLVVVLRRDKGPLNEIEKYRMSVLLATAFGAMFIPRLCWRWCMENIERMPCGLFDPVRSHLGMVIATILSRCP